MDINSEIAIKIMGWKHIGCKYYDYKESDKEDLLIYNDTSQDINFHDIWHPEMDMNQAKLIIEKMNDRGLSLLIEQSMTDLKHYKVSFLLYKDDKVACMGTGEDCEGNLAKAICLAALDTLKDKEDYWSTSEGIEQSR